MSLEQRDAAIDLNIRQCPLYMTNLLNLTHTTLKSVWRSMNLFLIRWLMRKHKRLVGRKTWAA